MRIFIILIPSLYFVGCASIPSREQIRNQCFQEAKQFAPDNPSAYLISCVQQGDSEAAQRRKAMGQWFNGNRGQTNCTSQQFGTMVQTNCN